jgi:hypothetical protein
MPSQTALLAARTPIAQGGYYLVTGIWPVVSIRSFERVTGPKTDRWLVKTVGSLIAVVGAVVALAGMRRRATPELCLLGAGSAAALMAADVIYVARGRISRVYLLDAIAEALCIGGWLAWLADSSSQRGE